MRRPSCTRPAPGSRRCALSIEPRPTHPTTAQRSSCPGWDSAQGACAAGQGGGPSRGGGGRCGLCRCPGCPRGAGCRCGGAGAVACGGARRAPSDTPGCAAIRQLGGVADSAASCVGSARRGSVGRGAAPMCRLRPAVPSPRPGRGGWAGVHPLCAGPQERHLPCLRTGATCRQL